MMPSIVLISIFVILWVPYAFSDRIWHGYSSNSYTDDENRHFGYSCGKSTVQDITIHIWDFNLPNHISSLTIKDCTTLRLYFGCSSNGSSIDVLKVSNIDTLHIIPALQTRNPIELTFENIKTIETIPANSFSQISTTVHNFECFRPKRDLQSIVFRNLTIKTIESRAFYNLSNMETFLWEHVSVLRLNPAALHVEMLAEKNITISRSSIDLLENLALQLVADNISITKSKFGEMYSNAINGTFFRFEFKLNSVNTLQANAISILAQNVYISHNRFHYLQSGALQKIGPRLLLNYWKNSGRVEFVYEFANNSIEHVDAGGLHPDILAYQSVAGEVQFKNNLLRCSCAGLAWLAVDLSLGYTYFVIKDFHNMILNDTNENMCSFSPCKMPLSMIRKLIWTNGTCTNQITIDNTCDVMKRNNGTTSKRSKYEKDSTAPGRSVRLYTTRYAFINVMFVMFMMLWK